MWEGDEEKRTASDNSIVEEKMDTESSQKTKRSQRRKTQENKGAKMEVEGESKDNKGFEDETTDPRSMQAQCSPKNGENAIDTSQMDDT